MFYRIIFTSNTTASSRRVVIRNQKSNIASFKLLDMNGMNELSIELTHIHILVQSDRMPIPSDCKGV